LWDANAAPRGISPHPFSLLSIFPKWRLIAVTLWGTPLEIVSTTQLKLGEGTICCMKGLDRELRTRMTTHLIYFLEGVVLG
jgi:hypothetical protein